MTTHAHTNQWTALPVLLAGAFMVVLDFFIVNVALPSIATELGAGESSLEWVVAGYGLAFAALLITSGRLGDGLGRPRGCPLGAGAPARVRARAGAVHRDVGRLRRGALAHHARPGTSRAGRRGRDPDAAGA